MYKEYTLDAKQKMNHPNLIGRYCMTDLTSSYFKGIVQSLKTEPINCGRKIVFCKSYRDAITIYQYFKGELKEYFTEPPGSIN